MSDMSPSAEERMRGLCVDWSADIADQATIVRGDVTAALARAYADGLASKEEAVREAVEREREANCRAIRDSCEPCSGTGGIGGGIHIVTREMAMDACDPDAEGMEIEEPGTECEYCGRPIAAIRACGEGR